MIDSEELKKGVMHIKELGFKQIWFSRIPFDELDEKAKRRSAHITLNDGNPVCRRLFDIFTMDNVIGDVTSTKLGEILFSATKPSTISDAFFATGFFKITK